MLGRAFRNHVLALCCLPVLVCAGLPGCSSEPAGEARGDGAVDANGELTGSSDDPNRSGDTTSNGNPAASPMGDTASDESSQPSMPTPQPEDVVIDDFSDGDGNLSSNGFQGTWATYSDGTSTVTPPVGADVIPVEGALRVSGAGFSEWGVGLSVDLNNPGDQRGTVDLSEFRGLGLRARGTGAIAVELVLPATTGQEEGGSCTGEGCFGHYSTTVSLDAEFEDHEIAFGNMVQPEWAQGTSLDLTQVIGVNFLARAAGAPANIDLEIDELALLARRAPVTTEGVNDLPVVADGSNPFAGRQLHSGAAQALNAYNSASGADRELLAKVALNPTAFWLNGGDPGRAGSIVEGSNGNYAVLVLYYIPDRDCSGESAGGAPDGAAYRSWIDGVAASLAGKEAAIILEPDALALGCRDETSTLISYAVSTLRQNPAVAVYIDGAHSNWHPPGEMANRLRAAGIEQATGFAVNVSNFEATPNLINYGKALSAQVGGKPFVIDTSRNGQGGPRDYCNPPGAGLGELPSTNTGDPDIHAFLWVKRPGESDGSCGQCAGVPAGQFCTQYALELARNAAF